MRHQCKRDTFLISIILPLVAVSYYVVSTTEQPQHVAAAAMAGSKDAFSLFLTTLPRHTHRYIFEGDLLYTSDELWLEFTARRHTRSRLQQLGLSSTASTRVSFADLLDAYLTVRRDLDDSWDVWPPHDRVLTYALMEESFDAPHEVALVRRGMQSASTDWKNACPDCTVSFAEAPRAAPTDSASATFVVRRHNGLDAIATAFYPSRSPGHRALLLGSRYFGNAVDHVGVLRHELGHILGYVHEHLSAPNPDDLIGICLYEDERHEAITPYDPSSVMHYFCADEEATHFAISDTDAAGHRRVYSAM